MLHHVAAAHPSEAVDFRVRDLSEGELVRDFVEYADEPGERVGERAVEVENYQVVFRNVWVLSWLEDLFWCEVLFLTKDTKLHKGCKPQWRIVYYHGDHRVDIRHPRLARTFLIQFVNF
jgi:hypothetical protein